ARNGRQASKHRGEKTNDMGASLYEAFVPRKSAPGESSASGRLATQPRLGPRTANQRQELGYFRPGFLGRQRQPERMEQRAALAAQGTCKLAGPAFPSGVVPWPGGEPVRGLRQERRGLDHRNYRSRDDLLPSHHVG